METTNTLPQLSAIEQRVLGTLMEKSKTTPDYYPMTLNSLTAACNQKTSRYPVTDYHEEEVMQAINSLKGRSLVSTAVGGGSRTLKFKHNVLTVYDLTDAEMAVICLLFLRGPQTPGEINTNSARLHEFSSLDSVMESLQSLRVSKGPFVQELPKRAGQKESRFAHLFSAAPESGDGFVEDIAPAAKTPLESRIAELELDVQTLKEQVAHIRRELFGDSST